MCKGMGGGGVMGVGYMRCVFSNSFLPFSGWIWVCLDSGSFSVCWLGGMCCIGWATHEVCLMLRCDILAIGRSSAAAVYFDNVLLYMLFF